jgi:hypothetical protein
LYTLRYHLALLRRDEREKALVGFYGHLAQAMTRDTYIGGEGSRFMHGDRFGRSFYLPPNTASNATFLVMLRYLLIQDWDLDEDGTPDTLRLLYAVPRRWFRDGAVISFHEAPTAFGPVSITARSHLSAGEVSVSVTSPPRRPRHVSLRVPLPSGWQATTATVEGKELRISADGSMDLSDREGDVVVTVNVAAER